MILVTGSSGLIGSAVCLALLAQGYRVRRLDLAEVRHRRGDVRSPADLEAAVEGAMVSKFRNGGQTCVCANRILVQEGVYDAFAAKLAEIQKEADAAFASLSDVDRARFSNVTSQLGRLGGVIASVTVQASALVSELAKAAQIDPGTKRLEAMRQQHAAQQASMDSLNAMREANERFNASEAARNALTREGVKLEREKEAVRKRAAEAGATLTDAQIAEAAQAVLDADAARAAADRAGRSSGGGGKSGGGAGGAEKLDEFAREAQAIKDRTLALQTEASVLATLAVSNERLGNATEYAAAKARLLVAAQEAGKQITPELEAQIDQLARGYVNAGQKAEQAAQQVQDADSKTEKGANALADLFSAGMEGSEAFGNALRSLAAEFAPLRNPQVWRFSIYYFFAFGAFVALALWLRGLHPLAWLADFMMAAEFLAREQRQHGDLRDAELDTGRVQVANFQAHFACREATAVQGCLGEGARCISGAGDAVDISAQAKLVRV